MTDARLVNGRYVVDGQPYARVTTVLNVINKPSLEKWKRRVGFAEADRISGTAREHGTAMHAFCEAMNKAFPADPPAPALAEMAMEMVPTMNRYHAWLHTSVRAVLAAERFVHHPAHRYAGTLDLLVELRDGSVALCDVKTGKTVDDSAALQLAAYMDALGEEGVEVDRRIVVHLPSNAPGVVRVKEFPDHAQDLRDWRRALGLYKRTVKQANAWREPGQEWTG